MYRDFTVSRFRGFLHLRIADLARINLVTGKNDVGKTALLEALFLHAGRNNPGLPMVVETIRGRGRFLVNARGIWGWLFPSADIEQVIELVASMGSGQESRVTIRMSTAGTSLEVPSVEQGTGVSATDGGPSPELLIEYKTETGESKVSRAYIDKGEVKVTPAESRPPYPCIYLSPRSRVDPETAERYTKLDSANRIGEVVKIIQGVDCRVKRIALGVEAGQPIFTCDIGLETNPPLHVVGEGVNRLLQIALAVAGAEGGLILVDELDNGLHHSAMFGVWGEIARIAEEYNVQVVASTHSLECIRSAYEAFRQKGDNDLAVYRLDRLEDQVSVSRYGVEDLKVLLAMEMEVRGS